MIWTLSTLTSTTTCHAFRFCQDIPANYFGAWKCDVQRKSRTGFGLEAAPRHTIQVQFRQSRLQDDDEDEMFQDYRVGERDAEVCVEAEVDLDKYEFVDAMWIVRREFRKGVCRALLRETSSFRRFQCMMGLPIV